MSLRDAQGVGWAVRATRLRGGESSRPWPGPELESLRRRLAGAVAPHPLPPGTLSGRGGWWTPADASDIALSEAAAEFRTVSNWGVWAAPRLVLDLVDHLRTPWSDVWRLEALARGRIRRWARWEVDGPEATHRAIASVSAALEAGRIPEPEGAVLVEVVDQRPAGAHRRSAGLGVVRPAG